MEIEDITHTIYRPIPLVEMERRAVLNALAYTDGNHTQAAKLLGIVIKTLYNLMHTHGIPGANGPLWRPKG